MKELDAKQFHPLYIALLITLDCLGCEAQFYEFSCPYAHRNAGDTERRYHPRYFKTGNCIYETTESGACVKNGLHCAFAHGPDDIRLPVYDIREVQDTSSKFTVNLPASLEKERVLSEDPKWNEMFHVLACYKTELCKKPPRMCRQGYSCPFYHNGKDKRRAPDRSHYRSTPCPAVRPGDEWQDSGLCEAGDACVCCHTRTEQQFHPEIYKSTKCNDVINSGYCPRGPFCAFAHCDAELTTGRDFLAKLKHEQQLTLGTDPVFLTGSMSHSHSRAFGATNVTLTAVPMAPQPHGNFTVPFQVRNPAPSDLCKRNTNQMPAALLPNLMSPIGSISSSPPVMGNVSGARGRRVGRCASPHQNVGLWQPATAVMPNDRSTNIQPQVTYTGSFPTACTTVTSSDQIPASVLLSGNGLATQHHLSFYHYRQPGIMTNSLLSKKGRHRSGGSLSSEVNVTTAAARDLVYPVGHVNTSAAVAYTSTYPGRCGSYVAPNTLETVRIGSALTSHSSSTFVPATQQAFRNASTAQSQQPNISQFGPIGHFPSSQSEQRPNQTLKHQHSPSHLKSVGDVEDLSFSRPDPMHSGALPLFRGALWNAVHSVSAADPSSTGDQFLNACWTWQLPVDSGNNSEASTNEVDTCGLLERGPGSLSGLGSHPSTSVLEASSRDSGLVLDFSVPTPSNVPDQWDTGSNTFQSNQSDRNYLSPDSDSPANQGRQLSTSHNLREQRDYLASTPNCVASDFFENTQAFYRNFMSHFEVNADGSGSAGAGFQSPLDDILLQTQPGFDSFEQVSGVGLPASQPNASSSPLADPSGSDPVVIPGRKYEPLVSDSSAQSEYFSDGTRLIPSLPAGAPHNELQPPSQQPRSAHRPIQQNTWPVSFTDIQETHGRCYLTGLSSPTASQTSQSFSPIVGTPAIRNNNQKHIFELGGSSGETSVNVARGSSIQASVKSNPASGLSEDGLSKTTDVVSDSSSPFQLDSGLTCTDVFKNPAVSRTATTSTVSTLNFNDVPHNPSSELERISLQRELSDIRQRLGSKEDEVEVLKKQCDVVTERLRAIHQLFSSLNVSSNDCFRPLFVNTDTSQGSGQSTGYDAPGFLTTDTSPLAEEGVQSMTSEAAYTGEQTSEPLVHTANSLTCPKPNEKTQLQQQQEALAALFSNPFVMALLKSTSLLTDASATMPLQSGAQPSHWTSDNTGSVALSQPHTPPSSALQKIQHPITFESHSSQSDPLVPSDNVPTSTVPTTLSSMSADQPIQMSAHTPTP
ncbi:RING finger protein unkempt [Paragonimus skrjabini miyazakii]|uniref:RING finger protein unkempt n=1 Tax=Paragonimus skrjabini miyazakii TaxID=59628 RepID=A0A8S9ZBD9_9TREM|nr:RING finger protein unkempt [Paragonimus skrjabini miyazakii]